jgi:hypothetical protein
MRITLVPIIGVLGTLLAPRIPLIVDDSGLLSVDAFLGESNVQFVLDYSDSVYLGPQRVEGEIRFIENETAIARFVEPVLNWFGRPDSFFTHNFLAIGTRSSLVEAFNSVDVIKSSSSAFFALSNSYDSFVNDFCYLGSVFNVPVDDLFGFADGYLDGFDSTILNVGFTSRSRLSLPNAFLQSLTSVIYQNSARIVQDLSENESLIFESCTVVRTILPPINVTFIANEDVGSPARGHLLFDPVDYTKIVHDDTCKLLVAPGSSSSSAIYIDFAMLKGVNMRFERDRISFCDSSL